MSDTTLKKQIVAMAAATFGLAMGCGGRAAPPPEAPDGEAAETSGDEGGSTVGESSCSGESVESSCGAGGCGGGSCGQAPDGVVILDENQDGD